MDLHQTAITAAFVMDGLHQADLKEVMSHYIGDGGLLEVVDDVMYWVPAITALRAAADQMRPDYPGVFEYEVSSEFGKWLGGNIIDEGDLPDRGHAMTILIDLVESFYRLNGPEHRDQRRRLRANLDAAADLLMAPAASQGT
jgi:hypothetical protein